MWLPGETFSDEANDIEVTVVSQTATGFIVTIANLAAPTQLAVVLQPGGAVSGRPFETQPVVELRDADGNPIGQAGVQVTATIASGPGSWAVDRTVVTTGGGRAVFDELLIVGAGTHTLEFSATGLESATSDPFEVSQPEPTVLVNDQPLTGLWGREDNAYYFVISVPSGATELLVETSGGGGDADLYVKYGSMVQSNEYGEQNSSCGFTGI